MTCQSLNTTERCCPTHASWTELAEHLVERFGLPPGDVLDEVLRARAAVERFGLEWAEQVDLAERIARNQIAIRLGEIADRSRLDPERHASRQAVDL